MKLKYLLVIVFIYISQVLFSDDFTELITFVKNNEIYFVFDDNYKKSIQNKSYEKLDEFSFSHERIIFDIGKKYINFSYHHEILSANQYINCEVKKYKNKFIILGNYVSPANGEIAKIKTKIEFIYGKNFGQIIFENTQNPLFELINVIHNNPTNHKRNLYIEDANQNIILNIKKFRTKLLYNNIKNFQAQNFNFFDDRFIIYNEEKYNYFLYNVFQNTHKVEKDDSGKDIEVFTGNKISDQFIIVEVSGPTGPFNLCIEISEKKLTIKNDLIVQHKIFSVEGGNYFYFE